jgi:glycosyltransferase involved in cell wall biosynthesis
VTLMPRVSVIIPTYNRAHLIGQAIDSLLAQTYHDFEVIVVDDGSTDNTQAVLSRYGDRITYIFQKNAGPSAARNTGIRASKGELLAFLDSDDMMSPTKLALQVAYLEAHPEVGVVYSGWQYLSEDGTTVQGEVRPDREGEILKDLLVEGYLFPPVAALMRRECIDRVGVFDESLPTYEDPEFWIRIALAGYRFGCIEQPLCQWRMTSGSLGNDLVKLEHTFPIVLQKVFSDPELSADIAELKDEVYANRYVDLGLYYYARSQGAESGADIDHARQLLSKALTLEPNILATRQDFLDLITHQAVELNPDDPDAHIRRVMNTVFLHAHKRSRLQSRLHGRLHIILAFRAYEAGRRAQVIHHLLQGLRYDPYWLRNRGVVSIFLKSLLGVPPRDLFSLRS